MGMLIKVLAGLLIAGFVFTRACSPANLEWVEERAEQRWQEQGFEVVSPLGYQWCSYAYGPYGGACVWSLLKRKDNGITYKGYLKRWGDDLHVYSISAIDAIRP